MGLSGTTQSEGRFLTRGGSKELGSTRTGGQARLRPWTWPLALVRRTPNGIAWSWASWVHAGGLECLDLVECGGRLTNPDFQKRRGHRVQSWESWRGDLVQSVGKNQWCGGKDGQVRGDEWQAAHQCENQRSLSLPAAHPPRLKLGRMFVGGVQGSLKTEKEEEL